jgi:hypothetical protein
MGYVRNWLQERHVAPVNMTPDRVSAVDLLKGAWLTVLLVLLGVMAIISAVLIAWPVLAHVAARFFL